MRLAVPAFLSVVIFSLPAFAAAIDVRQPWARATAPHQQQGAVYMTLHAASDDRLNGIVADGASMAMLHQTSNASGVSEMRDVDGLALPAGQDVTLAPRGTHIMLMGLKNGLKAGESVKVTLDFAKAGPIDVVVPVLPIGSAGLP